MPAVDDPRLCLLLMIRDYSWLLLMMIRAYSWLLLLMAIAIMTAADDDSRSAGRNDT